MNGHLMMIAALVESFHAGLRPSRSTRGVDGAGAVGRESFSAIGLMLALPILAALLIANLALGILTRAAPQLNIFWSASRSPCCSASACSCW